MKSRFAMARAILAALVHSALHPFKTAQALKSATTLVATLSGGSTNASRGYYSRKCRRARIFKRLVSNGMVKEAARYVA